MFEPIHSSRCSQWRQRIGDLLHQRYHLAEFKTLKGKDEGSNPKATTAAEFINGTQAGAPISTLAMAPDDPRRKY